MSKAEIGDIVTDGSFVGVLIGERTVKLSSGQNHYVKNLANLTVVSNAFAFSALIYKRMKG